MRSSTSPRRIVPGCEMLSPGPESWLFDCKRWTKTWLTDAWGRTQSPDRVPSIYEIGSSLRGKKRGPSQSVSCFPFLDFTGGERHFGDCLPNQ
jgi:hypothetical protein